MSYLWLRLCAAEVDTARESIANMVTTWMSPTVIVPTGKVELNALVYPFMKRSLGKSAQHLKSKIDCLAWIPVCRRDCFAAVEPVWLDENDRLAFSRWLFVG